MSQKNISILYMIWLTIIVFMVISSVLRSQIFPSKYEHETRNKYNTMPVSKLTMLNTNTYIDDGGIQWKKRAFLGSLYHSPFNNYVFESYDESKQSSSEAVANKKNFDNGIQIFAPGSYNYYSSYLHPFMHIITDIIPIYVYKNDNSSSTP